MNIIKHSDKEYDKIDIYKMTKGDTVSVRDAVGVEFKVDKYLLYEDVNQRGETVEILSIMADDRTVYSTVSETFKTRFFEIVDIFGDDLDQIPILITEGTSKSGRQYASCTVA